MNDDDGAGSVDLPYTLRNEASAIAITSPDTSAAFATFPSAATAGRQGGWQCVCQYGRYHRRGQLQRHDDVSLSAMFRLREGTESAGCKR